MRSPRLRVTFKLLTSTSPMDNLASITLNIVPPVVAFFRTKTKDNIILEYRLDDVPANWPKTVERDGETKTSGRPEKSGKESNWRYFSGLCDSVLI
jgi:hypothetical protein